MYHIIACHLLGQNILKATALWWDHTWQVFRTFYQLFFLTLKDDIGGKNVIWKTETENKQTKQEKLLGKNRDSAGKNNHFLEMTLIILER